MGIITDYKCNYRKSLYFTNEYSHILVPYWCYSNVSEIIREVYWDTDLRVGFCYYGLPNVSMVRHSVLISPDNEIIEVTTLLSHKEILEYHIFKIYEPYHYISAYYQSERNDLADVIPEEKDYYKYAVKNKIAIDKWSYDKYMKRYDSSGEIIVKDYLNKFESPTLSFIQ